MMAEYVTLKTAVVIGVASGAFGTLGGLALWKTGQILVAHALRRLAEILRH